MRSILIVFSALLAFNIITITGIYFEIQTLHSNIEEVGNRVDNLADAYDADHHHIQDY
jgi:hypothetical protein